MEGVTNYKILKDKGIIVEYYGGKIRVEDVINLKEQQVKNEDYNSTYNIIDDFRDADFVFTQYEIKKYIDYVRKGGKNYGKRKTAFLTKSPKQVAMLTLFNTMKDDLPIDGITCSTLEVAYEHVGIYKPEHKEEINTILLDFKGDEEEQFL